MLRMTLAGKPLVLFPKTSMSMEYFSPFFDEDVLRGYYSLTFSIPLEGNRETFGWPDIIESVTDLRRRYTDLGIEEDGQRLGELGELRIRTVQQGRVSVAVAFGLSRIAPELKERLLTSFAFGGLREVATFVEGPISGNGYPFQIPGLLLHANDTVDDFEGHDYVFAPVRNHFSELDPPLSTLVNPWSYMPNGLFGTRPNGSFQYALNIEIPGLPTPAPEPDPYSPFLKLSYLLQAVFEELNVPVQDLGLHGELASLVLLTSARIRSHFRLADVVPALSLKEALIRVRSTIGLVLDIGPDGSVRGKLQADVLASEEFEDWSHLVPEHHDGRDIEDVTGRTLAYRVAGGDTPAETFFSQPKLDLPIGAPVDTLAELPSPVFNDYMLVPEPELRVVVSLAAYYRSEPVYNFVTNQHTVSWKFHGSAMPAVDVAGGGEEVLQGMTATAMALSTAFVDPGDGQQMLVPAFEEEPYRPGVPESVPSEQLRLAFYRGLQPTLLDGALPDPMPVYPMVTPFNQNALSRRIGDYSLQLDGPDGTYARLIGRWLEMVATATPVKFAVRLTAEHLAVLDFSKRIRIAGNFYLVRKISVARPIVKPAIVELIPIPVL